ncbi:ribonuclease H-like domain-containing protein [Nemania sp. FL0031]|nr:ribonuclease H-like domain-containing protein [Nemania sp. FL0031]
MMRALGRGRCGVLYRAHILGFHRIWYRTLHVNRRLGPAVSALAPSSSIKIPYIVPCIVYQNGNMAVTVTTVQWRYLSASNKSKRGRAPSKPPKSPKYLHPYKWVSWKVSDDAYGVLESHILDSSLRASERFPVTVAPEKLGSGARKGVPDRLNPYNPEHQSPPSPLDPSGPHPRPRKTYGALVIDCEMVVTKGHEMDLLNIAVVDFFTGDIVLRSLVQPTGTVTHWRGEVTGFNKERLADATKKGKALSGWREVREKIFEVTTSETIFIGHALANDLRVLHIASDRVVDSMMMMSRAVFGDGVKFPRNWGLKTACQELLNVAVQKKRTPHSPLEDALATRELVLQCVLNPEKLAEWAAGKRAKIAQMALKEQAEREAMAERKKRRNAEKKKERSLKQLVQEAAESESDGGETKVQTAEREAEV